MSLAKPRLAEDPFRYIYRPWAERVAQAVGSQPEAIALAVVKFIAGRPFDEIARVTGLSRATVLDLYRMAWMHAVTGTPSTSGKG